VAKKNADAGLEIDGVEVGLHLGAHADRAGNDGFHAPQVRQVRVFYGQRAVANNSLT
jgi:hypothetical protein